MKEKFLLEVHWLDGGGFEKEFYKQDDLEKYLEELKKNSAEYSVNIYKVQLIKRVIKLNKKVKKVKDDDDFIDVYNEVFEDTQY